MKKKCSRCKLDKPLKDFYSKISKNGKSYKRGTCKKCHCIETKENREKNPEQRHMTVIKRKYGISKEIYFELMRCQNKKCAICEMEFGEVVSGRGDVYRPCVDHDHNTGKVRGLLCHNCNRVLGIFKDSPLLFEKAITYLKNVK